VRTDDDVVSAAKAGDPAAWRELYAAHAGRLVLWLRTLPTGDVTTSAEDLAAEAWLTAAEKIRTFHGTAEEFAGYLFGVARNLAANARRRAARRNTEPGGEAVAPHETVPGAEELVPGEDWVRRTLARLPRREREVLACLEVVGLDVASTARALGMTATAVRVARHRALARLRAARLVLA
jgi:RNA polymerase sigma-70 factor (ECF subfamily)